MPRVFQKKKIKLGADRSCGRCGKKIEPGDEYLSWSFRYGGTHFRCLDHPPRQSELTQSKLSEVYSAQETAEDEIDAIVVDEDGAVEGVKDAVQTVIDQIQETASEYMEAAEHFGGEGENAERADELESWSGELESFYPDEDAELEAAKTEAMELLGNCPL
jgi:hypothetical protein